MPSKIEQAHREFGRQGLTVLAINIGEKKADVAAWVKDKNLSVTVLLDEKNAATEAYRVVATPTVFIIDRDGKLAGKAIGPKGWDTDAGKAVFRVLLRAGR